MHAMKLRGFNTAYLHGWWILVLALASCNVLSGGGSGGEGPAPDEPGPGDPSADADDDPAGPEGSATYLLVELESAPVSARRLRTGETGPRFAWRELEFEAEELGDERRRLCSDDPFAEAPVNLGGEPVAQMAEEFYGTSAEENPWRGPAEERFHYWDPGLGDFYVHETRADDGPGGWVLTREEELPDVPPHLRSGLVDGFGKEVAEEVFAPEELLNETGESWDVCEAEHWYGDRVCDRDCSRPDPDCAEADGETIAEPLAEAMEDPCVRLGWYGDGRCDGDCREPDPDCGPGMPEGEDPCEVSRQYGDGFCDETCPHPDPDCNRSEGEPDDWCEAMGWYDDGVCDRDCPRDDPDCAGGDGGDGGGGEGGDGGGGLCGNSVCEHELGESWTNCHPDCGNCIDDGVCDSGIGENQQNCPVDCGDGEYCGNGYCDYDLGENATSCHPDCGICLDDGVCDAGIGENHQNCAVDCGG